jgi:hypothetical protein
LGKIVKSVGSSSLQKAAKRLIAVADFDCQLIEFWLREQDLNLSDLQNMNLPSRHCSIPALKILNRDSRIRTCNLR